MFIMEHYSAIKKNEALPFTMWRNPEGIMLSEMKSQRKIPYDLAYMQNLKNKAGCLAGSVGRACNS